MKTGKKKHSGSSLVSVIVAFAILMIGLAMFATALYAADSMTRKSRKLKDDCANAVEEFYQHGQGEGKPLDTGGAGAPMGFQMKAADGTGFSLYGEAMEWTANTGTDEEFLIYFFQAP